MKQKISLVALIGATAAGVVMTQIPALEGTKYVPYLDTGGILTVCSGVTVPPPIKGKTYTKEECAAMDEAVIAEHAQASVAYLPANAKDGHKILAVLAGYNLGPRRIKDSGLPEMIKNNDPKACSALVKYHYVAGKDCSVRTNNCYGVYRRRLLERDLCEEYNK
jgi:lysozyme